MKQKDFIAAIRQVSPNGADAMQSYIDAKDERLDLRSIDKYPTAYEVLEGIMLWDGTNERHRFWKRIAAEVLYNESNPPKVKTKEVPTVLTFVSPREDIKKLQDFLKTEGYRTTATGVQIIKLKIWKRK